MGYYYFPYSSLINALTSFLLGFFVLFNNYKSSVNRSFFYFTVAAGIWTTNYFIWLLCKTEAYAIFFIRAAMIGATLIPVTFIYFTTCLLNQKKTTLNTFNFILAGIFVFFSYSPIYIQRVEPRLFFPYWPVPGLLFHLMLIFFIICTIYAHMNLWRGMKNTLGTKNIQIKYVFFGTLIGFASGSTNYFLWYNIPIPPYPNILVTAYIVCVAYAIVRHQLMDIEVVIKKTLVFAALFSIVFAIFIGITLLTQELIAGGRILGLAISSIIIIFTVRPLEDFLINVTDKYLFQKKYDYKHLVRQFMEELKTMVLNARDIAQSTLDFLNSSIHPVSSAIFMYNKFTNKYDLIAAVDFKDSEFKLSDDAGFINELKNNKKIIDTNRDQLLSQQDKGLLSSFGIELMSPLLIHKELLGILCLGRKKSDEQYTEEDIEALSDLSSALSIAINNAQLFDERADAEKRAMIGTLATGINHEIGNPLNIISIRLQSFRILAKQGILGKKTKEDIIDEVDSIAEVCLNSAQRIAEITRKISEFAKPDKKLALDKTNVSEAIDETLSVLKHELDLEKIQFEKDIICEPPYVMADRGQLKQILFNLIKNAAHAIDKENGRIIVRVDKHGKDEIVMKVIDNGCGIPAAAIDKIFMPFYTTKEPGKGTGLGLALVTRLVERNNGRIEVESQEGKGTAFTMVFKGNCYE